MQKDLSDPTNKLDLHMHRAVQHNHLLDQLTRTAYTIPLKRFHQEKYNKKHNVVESADF